MNTSRVNAVQDDESERALTMTWQATGMFLPLATIAPLALEFVYRRMYSEKPSLLFDLLDFFLSSAVVAGVAVAARKTRARAWALIPSLGCAAAVLSAIQWIAINQNPSYDFGVYRMASSALLSGASPFPDYTYPPLFAQTLGYVAYVLTHIAPAGFDIEHVWRLVFYLYQVVQIGLVGSIFLLLYRMARALGADTIYATAIVTLIMLVNTPLQATVGGNQANLYVLALSLVALALVDTSAPLAGLATTLGGMIKVYPSALIPLWWISGRRTVAIWGVFFAVVLILAYPPLNNWWEFVHFWTTQSVMSYPGTSDATLLGLIANGARIVGVAPEGRPPTWIRLVFMSVIVAILIWGARRVWRRQQGASDADAHSARVARAISTAEVLALTLLLSPRAWPHQFIYAMPLAIVAATIVPKERRVLVALAGCLIFAFPWSNVFLASCVRPIGIALLLFLTPPHLTPATQS
ncbi:MAG: DUF2029 domain-containing protein [Acidobacteriaceae bacterium]|jgi:hypothetical protein|nr:DUF2029 domain-containing protein [Acidobacteriaceae bacterium]